VNWSKWFKWLGLYAGATALLALAFYTIRAVTELNPLLTRGGRTAVGLISGFLAIWAVRGLYLISRGEARRASSFLQVSITTLLLAAGIGGVYFAVRGVPPLESDFGWMLLGAWALTWLFIGLIELLRWLLGRGGSVLGVAKTVLDEAVRMKIAVAFMVLLLIILACLPFAFGGDTPLRYRVQTFLTYSLMGTSVLLSLLTVVLACATLSWEIEHKQIFTVVSKPISRGAHLLGKWVGVMVLNAVLLTVSALAIYGFTVFYLAKLPEKDSYDRQALETEVLTAREAVTASPDIPFEQTARKRLARIEQEDRQHLLALGEEVARQQGLGDVTPQRLLELGRGRLMPELLDEAEKEWRVVEPGETGVFIFEGLSLAKERSKLTTKQGDRLIQFLYKTDASTNLEQQGYEFPVVLRINGMILANRDGTPPKFVTNSAQALPLPAALIDDKGMLKVEVINVNPYNPYERRDVTLTFSSREKMEVLYHKGDFAMNFLRGVLAMYTKFAFLAMLGLAAATFLSFPVAVVLALLVTVAAMASPYLLESTRMFGNNPQDFATFVAFILKNVGKATALLLSRFAEFRPTPLIVDGREFSWMDLGRCALWVGLVWTALAGAIGWMIYRNRELARVQV